MANPINNFNRPFPIIRPPEAANEIKTPLNIQPSASWLSTQSHAASRTLQPIVDPEAVEAIFEASIFPQSFSETASPSDGRRLTSSNLAPSPTHFRSSILSRHSWTPSLNPSRLLGRATAETNLRASRDFSEKEINDILERLYPPANSAPISRWRAEDSLRSSPINRDLLNALFGREDIGNNLDDDDNASTISLEDRNSDVEIDEEDDDNASIPYFPDYLSNGYRSHSVEVVTPIHLEPSFNDWRMRSTPFNGAQTPPTIYPETVCDPQPKSPTSISSDDD